jgi:hypothetical protein
MASADVVNPQTFNRYVYVGNNPVNITDPTGEIWGQSGNSIQWFADEAAMAAKNFTAVTAFVGYIAGTNQLVALNPNANAITEVADAAAAIRALAGMGAAAGALTAAAEALLPAVAAAGLTAAFIYNAQHPEQQRIYGCPAYNDCPVNGEQALLNKMMNSNSEGGSNSSSANTQGTTSSANPDPNDNQPRYEKSDKHGKQQRGNAAPAPTNGQSTLDRSVQVRQTSPRRVGVDPATGEYVVFDQTTPGVFHGHTRGWDGLTRQMKNALVNSGQTNKRGKIQ